MNVWKQVVVVACFGGTLAWSQDSGRVLRFSLDREGPAGLQYTLAVDGSGSGTYRPHLMGPASGPTVAGAADSEGQQIHVSPSLTKKLFAAVPMVEGGRCETHSKSIAKTGVKVLRFTADGKDAECTYNYSDDDRVNEATQAFEAVAETLQYGDRLRSKLRFDRLGLDAELEGLQNAVAEQRALEVGNIASILHLIVADERVMDRVRRKAELLLQSAPGAQTAEGGSSAR